MSYNVAVKSFNTFRNSKHSTASPRESSVSHKIVLNHQTLKPQSLQNPTQTVTSKMALRTHLFFPNTLIRPPKFHSCPFPTTTHFRTRIPCTNKNSLTDADLASGLATEVAKINTHLVQREEAMKKSRELLFTELCNYLALDKEEVEKKWSKMDQEEIRVLVKGFVNEWGANFHPLSARSVEEMIEEYLHEEKPSSNSSRSMLFPGLKRIMGFSE